MEFKKGEVFKAGRKVKRRPEVPPGCKPNFYPSAPSMVETMKGPAFWNTETKSRRQQNSSEVRSLWMLEEKPSSPRKFLGMFGWWQTMALILVATVIALFFTMMGLFGAYISKAGSISSEISHLQIRESRLKEAVRKEAVGKILSCIPCQDNWVQHANYCYMHSAEEMSWEDCRAHCKKLHANFLTGKTEGELEILLMETREWFTEQYRLLVPRNYWIGLMYNTTQKTWHWADGTLLHLRLPGTDKPPHFSTDSCIWFNNGKVINKNCASRKHCLCKKMAG